MMMMSKSEVVPLNGTAPFSTVMPFTLSVVAGRHDGGEGREG